jgi:hypothetical protein
MSGAEYLFQRISLSDIPEPASRLSPAVSAEDELFKKGFPALLNPAEQKDSRLLSPRQMKREAATFKNSPEL